MRTRKRRWIFPIILSAVLILSMTACGKKDNDPFTYRAGSTATAESDKEETTAQDLYMIEELNTVEENITLLSLDTGRQLRYSYSLTTKFLDKYGDSTSSMNFLPGLVVTIGDLLDTKALSSVQISDDVWVNDSVKKYSVDTDKGILTIGQTRYRITDDTVCFSDANAITFADLGEDDILRVVGQDKNVLSVSVITGHGYIQLANTDTFNNSLICIGDKIYTLIAGEMTIEVPEGTYDVTVANNGYGGTASYTVARNETTLIDLNTLKGDGPKYCTLSFQVSVAGAAIYLDGSLVNANEEMSIAYGKHSLAVIAEGYDTWQKTLVVNSSKATIVLDLSDEEEDTTSTTTTTDDDDDSASSSSNASSSNTTNSNSSSSSSTSDSTKAEVDYLTTISDMISSMLSN